MSSEFATVQIATERTAVIRMENGNYLKCFDNDQPVTVGWLCDARFYFIGGHELAYDQHRLTRKGEYYQVVVVGIVAVLP